MRDPAIPLQGAVAREIALEPWRERALYRLRTARTSTGDLRPGSLSLGESFGIEMRERDAGVKPISAS
jgi:hypothetical protein